MDALTDSQLPGQRHSWRRAESATCIENFRRASRNFSFQLPPPIHLLPYIAGVTFFSFSCLDCRIWSLSNRDYGCWQGFWQGCCFFR